MTNNQDTPSGSPLVLGLCLISLLCCATTLKTVSTPRRSHGDPAFVAPNQYLMRPQDPGSTRSQHSRALSKTQQPSQEPASATAGTSQPPDTSIVSLGHAGTSPELDDDFRLQFITEEQIGTSVGGVPIQQIRIGHGDYVILMLAAIHGNESAGTPLLDRLAQHLQDHADLVSDCTVILLPEVNPDGVRNKTRWNAQGVDLNRNFPAENRKNSRRYGMHALSEPESLAIFQAISRWLPDHIITLHEPLNCVDYDGPAADLAECMSAQCPLPVKKLGSRPGSLGSYAGLSLGVPIITFELPRAARDQTPQQLWESYGAALVAAVKHRHLAQVAEAADNQNSTDFAGDAESQPPAEPNKSVAGRESTRK